MLGLQTALIRFAIRFRGIVVALSALLLTFGVHAFLGAKYDVFPEFAPPEVGIQTEAPGLAPEQVELLVTAPLEAGIEGLAGVEALRSSSIQGLSVVTVVFRPGSDIYRARQLVAERLAVAGTKLPAGVQPPAITPLTSSASTVLVVGLTSETKSLIELRRAAEWTVGRRLLATDGIAKVTVFGGETGALQIQLRPAYLVRHGLGIDEVVTAARRATGIVGSGFVETEGQRILLQATAPPVTPDSIAATVVAMRGGVPLTLGDVATVAVAPEPAVGGATIDGRPGVLLMVGQQFGSNTLEVTRRAETALRELQPGLAAEGITLRPDLFRPANFIVTATNAVELALLLGAALVIVVLFVFLADWRTALISCAAIPLSLLAAGQALLWAGATLNTMTLGGLAIAIGEVVDDAVIDVENIVRRLAQNRAAGSPRAPAQVVLEASLEVRGAVVYATFAVILAFAPVLASPGLVGRLFAPLAAAYALAVLASLAVALTLTPALAALLLLGRSGARVPINPPVARFARRSYERLIGRTVGRAGPVIAATLLLTVLAAATLPFFATIFLPELKEGHFIVHALTAPGTSLGQSLRLGERLSAALLKLPAVRSIGQHVGRAELADDTSGTHDSEFEIDLKPGLSGAAQLAAERDIERVAQSFPGVDASINTFLTERVQETLSGAAAAVAIEVFGSDLDRIDQIAAQVADLVDGLPGADNVRLRAPAGLPQLSIQLSVDALRRWGFDPLTVLEAIRTAYQGEVVGQVHAGDRVQDMVVVLDPAERARLAAVGDLPLRSPEGRVVPLRLLATIDVTSGRYQVPHLSGQRVQSVTLNVKGGDVAAFVAAARARIAKRLKLPPDIRLAFAGSAEAQAQAQRDLLLNSAMAIVGIVLVLVLITRSWRNLVLVMANLPFAVIGGVAAVWVTGGVLSVGSTVGFVTLFGITLRNAIMMLSHYEHLVVAEGRAWNAATAIEGAADRLVPIVMTSLVTAVGLLPLALNLNEPGREIEGPMAVVILGGLVTSMLLNLFVLPALALRFGQFAPASDAFAVAGQRQ